MRPRALLPLLGMRYKLMWAQVRLRNGKIILFLVGYLIVALLIPLFLAGGGIGAAVAAIQSGRAEFVARLVLGIPFAEALVISLLLGFGMNKIYSDEALRRYPLTALERLAARQFIGVLEPLWLLVLALNCGVALGLSATGVTAAWLALPAGLALILANYLLARFLLSIFDRLMATSGGTLVMMLLLMGIPFSISLLAPMLASQPGYRGTAEALLRFTPPFAAAAVMAGKQVAVNLLQLLGWCGGLAAGLFLVERIPMPSRTVAGAEASWGGFYDRVAGLFPSAEAPLVGKTLRYYLRSNRVRFSLILNVAVLVFIVALPARGRVVPADPKSIFVSALFASFVIGVIGTSYIDVNIFGFEGSGFRRFLLLPVSPVAILRSVTLASLLIGAAEIPVGLAAWMIFSPYPSDWRMPVMLVSSAVAGLFLFRGLALWAALLSPRKANFNQTFGNQLSLGGNIVMISGVLFAVVLPQNMRQLVLSPTLLAYWWAAPLLAPLAAAFFWASLRAGAIVFHSRRERLLGVMEGRS